MGIAADEVPGFRQRRAGAGDFTVPSAGEPSSYSPDGECLCAGRTRAIALTLRRARSASHDRVLRKQNGAAAQMKSARLPAPEVVTRRVELAADGRIRPDTTT
jgi:hypothetical protein